jgi:anaerobic magnesium-protoporphyrin IX monomethyl ester cyclase
MSRVALIGRRLPHNENLGLAYLRSALSVDGIASTTSYVNDAADVARAAQRVLTERPDVVGLSLADGGSALLPLALGEALRRAGYRGHITCGGQFATLARDWLLSRYDFLDSVVRFAGERAIVQIARRVSEGRGVDGIAGVTTRRGDGAPTDVLDRLPYELRPERDELPAVLGFPAAHIAASRGCWGRCQYCGPAALSTLERREGIRAGIASSRLTTSGVGGLRRRDLDRVCDEMAELWHERGVRYFYFVDEHLLPYDEPSALAFLREWRAGLRARDVGPLGIGCMLRADRVSPAVVREFAETGLVRLFVGLELGSEEEGRHFGRRAPGQRELSLIRDFADQGVATVGNLMLVHPYSTLDTIARGIDLLESVPAGVFEATRMMVYHGTRLEKTMAEEGRLIGNPLRYGYTFPDPSVERFAEIFTRLRGDVFYDYSLAYRTHDAFLAFGLARRVVPERVSESLYQRLETARRDVNALYVGAYRRALELARQGVGFVESAPLIHELQPRARGIEDELEEIEEILMRAAPSRGRMFAPMRSAAVSAISFALLACGGETSSQSTPKDAGGQGGTGGSATGGSGGTVFTGGSGGTGGTVTCTAADAEAAKAQTDALIAQKASCFSGYVSYTPPLEANASPYGYGGFLSLRACTSAAGQAALQALGQQVTSLANELPACLAPGYTASIQGGAQSDIQKMTDAIQAACGSLISMTSQFIIVLDAKGNVVQVNADPSAQALADCVKKALTGLTFPCLASFEVCPEYVIAE